MVAQTPDTRPSAERVPSPGAALEVGALPSKEAFAPSTPNAEEALTFGASEILKRGTTGIAVFELQERINVHRRQSGFERIKVDGDFGPNTEKAVKELQKGLNDDLRLNPPLKVDGIWGPRSDEALKTWELRQRERATEGNTSNTSTARTFTQTGFYRGEPYAFAAKEILDVDGQRFILCAPAAVAFEKMRAHAMGDGVTLKINSAFRTNEEQAKLRANWEAGVGNPANRPGFSDHQSGFAIDIRLREDPKVLPWLDKHAGEYGFDRPKRGQVENGRKVSNEPWHWEFVDERERLQRNPASR